MNNEYLFFRGLFPCILYGFPKYTSKTVYYCESKIDSGSCYGEERNFDLSFSSSRVERSIGAPFETSLSRPNAVPLLYLCPRCPYKTKSKGLTLYHLWARFSMKIDLSRHTLTHTGFKPHKCPRCGKGFIRNDRMLVHLRTCNRESVHIIFVTVYLSVWILSFKTKTIARLICLKDLFRSMYEYENIIIFYLFYIPRHQTHENF
ncbi:hypothetical protein Anas_07298 [Armadillidium nasatum]|uniref:C2H2-type domain-containing protein n=1 Tax=Armadillidium nasatum TaxID=96803 RepID=A0A5N5T4A3_9CRUS|nr:hypothetical protein Anas_07298 [Armadillidium nasatum]